MSAWYVFTAMGFYPGDPVSGEYQLCSPLFDKILLQLQGSKKLEIVCSKKDKAAMYMSSVMLNGKLYDKSFIRYADMMQGGKMEITLTAKPPR